MDIKFKYRMSIDLEPLVRTTIINYNDIYLYGILPEELAGQLKHCSLYLVCSLDYSDNVQVWQNPLAIVAKNEKSAVEKYAELTNSEIGSVLCEIANRCDKLKVIPC